MPETFVAWLERQMRIKGVNAARLAKEITVSPSAISRWRAGGAPDTESCAKLAEFFGRPLDEVYAAAGHPSPPNISHFVPARSLREQALEFIEVLPTRVPVQEQLASAGSGQEVFTDYVYLDPSYSTDGSVIAIRVTGLSMEPEILDGDVIVVDKDLEPDVGDIVVAVVGDNFFVKRYRRRGNRITLVGNTGEIAASDGDIQGVVTETIHRFRNRRGRR